MRRAILLSLSLCILPLTVVAEEQSTGTKFVVAIEGHDLEAVKALIEGGAAVDTPINYGDDHSITPLLQAAWSADLPIVEYLLSKGANVNAVDTGSNVTALMNAVTQGSAEIVSALIAAKADVHLRNKYDFNAFTSAAAAGNQEIAGLLLDAGAKINDGMHGLTPLAFAVSSGDISMMRFLVGRGADVNYGAKSGAQTPLISAVLGAQIESVKTLIELKADVNAKMKDGMTPLKYAQKGDQEEIIALLVAAGAK